MEKISKNVIERRYVEKSFFKTIDGAEFESENDALYHEKSYLETLKVNHLEVKGNFDKLMFALNVGRINDFEKDTFMIFRLENQKDYDLLKKSYENWYTFVNEYPKELSYPCTIIFAERNACIDIIIWEDIVAEIENQIKNYRR